MDFEYEETQESENKNQEKDNIEGTVSDFYGETQILDSCDEVSEICSETALQYNKAREHTEPPFSVLKTHDYH